MGCYDTDLYFKKPSIKVLTWHFRERRVDSHAPGKGSINCGRKGRKLQGDDRSKGMDIFPADLMKKMERCWEFLLNIVYF